LIKRILTLLMIFCLLAGTLPAFASEEDVKIFINNDEITFDTKVQIVSGRTMLPMRAIFETLGASVFWNDTDQKVLARKGKTDVLLTVGEETAYVNDKMYTLDVSPIISNGRTLVPARFVAESLGAEVLWDETQRRVDINVNKSALQENMTAQNYTVKSVTAIGHDGNKPENTVDGKYGTRWSHEGGESWIVFELEEIVPVAYIGTVWYMGGERQESFEVHLSKDGTNYTPVFDGRAEMSADMVATDLSASGIENAKYVKLLCKGNTANLWNSLCEIKIYPPHQSGELVVDAPASLERANASKELVEILQKYDEAFGMDFARWLASLYDVESGGFYFARSGRDYPGFAPDIESTSQAVGLMQNTGLWDSEAIEEGMIPEWFVDGLSNFALERQNPDDGYFYDPHFGTDVLENKKGRNLFQSVALISLKDGAKPKYKTPTERLAELNKSENSSQPGGSVEISVDPRFVSEESCRKWLEENFAKHDAYTAANNVAASWSLVEAANLEEVVREFLRAKQNPETGLFGNNVDMAALNAAMKAGCAFNSVEAPYPNYLKVIKSAAEVMKNEPAYTCAEVWNPLSLIERVVSSNSEVITDEDLVELDAQLAELFKINYEKYIAFHQSDGGFGWYKEGASPFSQDGYVSMGFAEGDTNGTDLARRARDDSYKIAGIAKPKLFTKEEKAEFWKLIRESKPVEKVSEENLPRTIDDDFESYTNGKVESGWRVIRRGNGNAEVVDMNRAVRDNDNSVLKITGGGRNTMVDRKVFVPEEFKTAVAKFDMYVEGNGANFYNYFGSGRDRKHTGFCWCIFSSNDLVTLTIRRTGDGGGVEVAKLNANEWYEMEMHYTPMGDDCLIEIFVDGEKVCVSHDSWLGEDPNFKPTTDPDGFGFVTFNDCTSSIYVDNFKFYFK